VTAGQYVTIYEINSTSKEVVNYVCRQITADDLTGTTVEDYYYYLNTTNNTAIIIKYSGSGGAVGIPGTLNSGGTDYTVTAISNGTSSGTGAFCSARITVTSVTFPDSLISIGNYAFYGCNNAGFTRSQFQTA
jgi:hypothetical protein